MTSLHNEVFDFGAPIIQIGEMPIGIIFVKERGITVLGIMETVRLLDFYEQSYVGEWEVIFQKPAERSYIAMNKNHQSDLQTQVYFIKPDDFRDILNVF